MGRIVNLGKEENQIKVPNWKGYSKLRDSSAYSVLTQILSINGGGFLKSAFTVNANTGSAALSQLRITVDGSVIINLSNLSTTLGGGFAQGIVDTLESDNYVATPLCVDDFAIAPNYIFQSVANVALVPVLFPSSAEQVLTANGALFILPELIRFNSSLKIELRKGNTYLRTGIEYYLD